MGEENPVPLVPMSPEQGCLLLGRPCCPFPALNLFWKITIGATAILMLVFSLTLFLMARSVEKYAIELRDIRTTMLAGATDLGHKIDGVGLKIDGHKQLTLENRLVTSEIRGALASLTMELGFKKFIENKK
jgi:hypothetical protein